ncbi:hypothetical protein Droror1_Dr00012762 [Drosera rotundifolia]
MSETLRIQQVGKRGSARERLKGQAQWFCGSDGGSDGRRQRQRWTVTNDWFSPGGGRSASAAISRGEVRDWRSEVVDFGFVDDLMCCPVMLLL